MTSSASDLPNRTPPRAASANEVGRIAFGTLGDQPLVSRWLIEQGVRRNAEEIGALQEEPGSRPSDRLLLRRGSQLCGQVRVVRRIHAFDGVRVPCASFEDLHVDPTVGSPCDAAALIAAAETVALREGAVLAMIASAADGALSEAGWQPLRGQGHSRADARQLLAHLEVGRRQSERRLRSTNLRTGRQFEWEAVAAVYDQAAAQAWGATVRSADYWRWLLALLPERRLLLAAEQERTRVASPTEEHALSEVRLQGYAIVHGSCLLELATAPDNDAARLRLLTQACRDAIEHGRQSVALYAPACDPLHELMVLAGGDWLSDQAGVPRWHVKLLSPQRWVERLYDVWLTRAREASLPRPLAIDFIAGTEASDHEPPYRFLLTRRSARWEPAASQGPAGVTVRCDLSGRQSLLVGNLSIARAAEHGRLVVDDAGRRVLTAMFAPRFHWKSPLERIPD